MCVIFVFSCNWLIRLSPHYLVKVRSSSFGISRRKCWRKCNMHWFLNTHPILMHLAYLFTCCFNFRFLLIFFVNSRWFYLNKCCELKERFLHVWYGIEQTIIDNAIDDRGMDVFKHVCGKKSRHFEQLLWQYSAIWQELFQFLSNVTRFLDCFFVNYQKLELLTFARYCGNILKVWLEVLYGFCSKFTSFHEWKKFEKLKN